MQPINTTVRIAVAAALAAAAATPASAIDISAYAGNAANNVNVYISGSTALDNNIISAAVQTAAGQTGVCAAGTVDRYVIGGPTNQLIYCTGNAASGVSGKPLAIFKESNVGSSNGVQPLINVAKGFGGRHEPSSIRSKVTDGACTTAVVAVSGDLGSYTEPHGLHRLRSRAKSDRRLLRRRGGNSANRGGRADLRLGYHDLFDGHTDPRPALGRSGHQEAVLRSAGR